MLDHRVVFETCEFDHLPKESLSIILAPSSYDVFIYLLFTKHHLGYHCAFLITCSLGVKEGQDLDTLKDEEKNEGEDLC
jgi:hypothetical protein